MEDTWGRSLVSQSFWFSVSWTTPKSRSRPRYWLPPSRSPTEERRRSGNRGRRRCTISTKPGAKLAALQSSRLASSLVSFWQRLRYFWWSGAGAAGSGCPRATPRAGRWRPRAAGGCRRAPPSFPRLLPFWILLPRHARHSVLPSRSRGFHLFFFLSFFFSL